MSDRYYAKALGQEQGLFIKPKSQHRNYESSTNPWRTWQTSQKTFGKDFSRALEEGEPYGQGEQTAHRQQLFTEIAADQFRLWQVLLDFYRDALNQACFRFNGYPE